MVQVGLAGKLVAPSWQEAVNTTAAVLASITALAALVTVVDSFWLAVYQVRTQLLCIVDGAVGLLLHSGTL